MKLNIQIKELSKQNENVLETALQMMNRTQGDGIFKMSYLTSKIGSKEALVVGAFIDSELIGVGCAEIITDFSYYINFEKEIRSRLKDQRVGSLCSLCVREDLQGKGIGQSLTKQRLQWLKIKHCDCVLGVSWKSGLANTSDRVFQKTGFRLISKVKEFYKESSIKYPFECPGCKSKPCTCSAELYEYIFKN